MRRRVDAAHAQNLQFTVTLRARLSPARLHLHGQLVALVNWQLAQRSAQSFFMLIFTLHAHALLTIFFCFLFYYY